MNKVEDIANDLKSDLSHLSEEEIISSIDAMVEASKEDEETESEDTRKLYVQSRLIDDLIELVGLTSQAIEEFQYAVNNQTNDLTAVREAIEELDDRLEEGETLRENLDYLQDNYYTKIKNPFYEEDKEQE